MKTSVRTISVFVVLILVTGSLILAQDTARKRDDEAVRRDIVVQEIRQAKEKERELEALRRQLSKQEEDFQIQSIQKLGLGTTSQPGAGRVLVIPAAQSTAEELLTITEDMSVMSYIFDEKLGRSRTALEYYSALGDFGGFPFSHGREATQSIYLDGYGALFVMKVDFLLSPPAKAGEEEKPEEGVDSVWQEAKRKIFQPEEGSRYQRRRPVRKAHPEEKYDAEKVEDLKRKLIKALKHAANIRNLKPDDQVILSVTGRDEPGKVATKVQVISDSGQILVVKRSGDREEARIYSGPEEAAALASQMGHSSPTVMTIRAKKADVDAFYQGEMDFDKFRRKVQIFTH